MSSLTTLGDFEIALRKFGSQGGLASSPSFTSIGNRHSVHLVTKKNSYSNGLRASFGPMRLANVKRWDPQTQSTACWDGLRYDHELFDEASDCLVYLHAKGSSQRNAPFRTSLHRLHDMQCGRMLSYYYDEGCLAAGDPVTHRLFIPSPTSHVREESFTWHLTTRNFFAFLSNKPLVGAHLGKSLVDLQDRVNIYRADDEGKDNFEIVTTYLGHIGYLNFSHHADYALAVLYYAEYFKCRALWIDSFCHCVGMASTIGASSEYKAISDNTKLLLERASLDMELRIYRISQSLSNFMENDFPIVDLGPATRGHLDRFRSFLLKYYHGKFVHWPPLQTPQFSKPLYKSMHLDFLALFHYLVDYDSANLRYPEDLGEVGGINVLHHITKFNTQHGYKPLPYSMPLIPRAPLYAKAKSQRRSIALNLKASHLPRNRKRPVQSSLRSAANTEDIRALESPLVRDYMVFERDSAVHIEGLSLQDARRVCWILVYCVLQELISVTSVPKMVRDIDKSTYPLCVDTSDLLPWKEGESAVYRISPASNIDISRRNSIIKNSPLPCYCEINVHGYGNGLKNFSVETISRTTIDLSLPPVLLSKSPTKNTFKSSFSDYSSDSVSDYSVSDCSASDCSPSDYSASDCSPSDYSASDYSASAGCNSNSDYSASKDFTSENLTSKYSSSNLFASDYDFDNPRSNNSSHEELYPKPLRVRTSGPKQLNSVGHKINYRSNRLYLDLSSV